METQEGGQMAAPMFQALDYAKMGWAVLPLHNRAENAGCSCGDSKCVSVAKHPRTSNGSKDASQKPMVICNWWHQWPFANVGIATGQVSGIIVVDVDPRHGGDISWEEFSIKHCIIATLRVQTGGGGFHLFYKCPDEQIGNKANILPGVDIRGQGGYVVAPPSQHSSGAFYTWANNSVLQQVAPFPQALLDLIKSPKPSSATVHSFIPKGARNSTLASVAGLLRRHGLVQEVINKTLTIMNDAICQEPLSPQEVQGISKSISKYDAGKTLDDWPDPKPLPEIRSFVPRMTEDFLPEVLRPWVVDICDRMQIPLEFIAAPVIIFLSTVIGRQIGIYPKQKDDWFVIPNLWGAVIARPGFFKSPAIAEALKPLEHLVKKERAKYESALVVAKSKEEIIKARIEGIKDNVKKAVRKGNQHEIDALQCDLEDALNDLEAIHVNEKRYKTNDATIEKIGALLLENPEGIMVFRDELSGWLKSLQKSGREGDREFFLEAWNGYGSYTVDRIGRGTLHIPSLCLSIFGGLQPGKLDSYISQALYGGEGDDGLLQRFQILVYPEPSKKWKNVDRKPNEEYQKSVKELFEALAKLKLDALKADKNDCIPGLRFSKEGQDIFVEWREGLETRLRSNDSETPAFESHLSKYRKLVPSLALIFHLCEHPRLDSIEVGASSVRLAIKWAQLLEAHAKKIYSNIIYSEISSAHAFAKKIKSNEVTNYMTVRSIYRKGWLNLENSKQVDKALALLEDLFWLRVEQVKSSTKPRDEVFLNPKLIFQS